VHLTRLVHYFEPVASADKKALNHGVTAEVLRFFRVVPILCFINELTLDIEEQLVESHYECSRLNNNRKARIHVLTLAHETIPHSYLAIQNKSCVVDFLVLLVDVLLRLQMPRFEVGEYDNSELLKSV